jgi:7-cyano-7-deazaguanine synthase
MPEAPAAVVLLSGGLDSAVTLAIARAEGRRCACLSFDYGQRHRTELEAARRIAGRSGAVDFRVVSVDLRAIGGSALTDDILVPGAREKRSGVPITYVPARNLLFLSVAAGYAEVVGASEIYIGVNAVDFSGYPDCRPEFIRAFEHAAALGTKAGVEGRMLHIRTPLITMTKAGIIRRGTELGVDFRLTRSCYDPDERGRACGRCESCEIRRAGFTAADVADTTEYSTEFAEERQ